MKIALKIAGIVVALVVVLFGLQIVAGESGEVVLLTTVDDAGEPQETRLWIVDYADRQWLRAGNPGFAWYPRVQRSASIDVARNGVTARYRPVPVPDARELINLTFAAKYGWAEAYVSVFASRDLAVPIRLEPLP